MHVASWIAKKEASLGKLNGLKQKINEQQIEREISLEDYRLFVVDKSAKKKSITILVGQGGLMQQQNEAGKVVSMTMASTEAPKDLTHQTQWARERLTYKPRMLAWALK